MNERQPVGTNHFQFRDHQPRRAGLCDGCGIGGGIGGGGPEDGSTERVTTLFPNVVENDPSALIVLLQKSGALGSDGG